MEVKMNLKTETEYSLRSIKFLLLTITTMFIIVAGLMMVIGLSVYGVYHDVAALVSNSSAFVTPSVLMVFIGVVMLIVSLFGFFGGLRESTLLVNTYAFVLSLVLVMELSVVIAVFTMDESDVLRYLDVPVGRYTADYELKETIDAIQDKLKCCGSDSYLDYAEHQTEFYNNSLFDTVSYGSGDQGLLVPASCCNQDIYTFCETIHNQGCVYSIVSLVAQNSGVLGVLGTSVAFIQLLGVIFAVLLGKSIRKAKSERVYLRWKAFEQMIAARKVQLKNDDQPPVLYIDQPKSSRA